MKVSVYSSIGLLTDDAKAHAALTSTVEGWFMVGILGSAWLFAAFINADAPGDPVWLDVYWVLAAMCAAVVVLLAVTLWIQFTRYPDSLRWSRRAWVKNVAMYAVAMVVLELIWPSRFDSWWMWWSR